MRRQEGNLWKCRGVWYLRYRDNELQPDGTIKRIQKVERLALAEGETRSKDSKVLLAMAKERMDAINGAPAANTPYALMTIGQFVENKYLPWVKQELRPTSYRTRDSIWRNQLKGRVAHRKLRDFHTPDGLALLQQIAKDRPDLYRVSLRAIKAELSAIFKHARLVGAITIANPMQDVPVPKASKSAPRGTYTLDDIQRMLQVLTGTAKVLVATAAFAGLRRGELQGLHWADYDGQELQVRHNLIQGKVGEVKTDSSNAPVPVIPFLRRLLNEYRKSVRGPLVFSTSCAGWLNVGNFAGQHIAPELKRIGLDWYGWHGFRRGLATNLHRLGVPDKECQAILRHSNVRTTQQSYIRTSSEDSIRAMAQLEAALSDASVMQKTPILQ